MPFSKLGLPDTLQLLLAELKYTKPYPIQEATIPSILKGKDVLGIAPTGSGKTATYVLPILQRLQRLNASRNRMINVLVLAPTRELCVQVEEVFKQFNRGFPKQIESLAVYGGVSINPQMKALYGVDVLVATPGRLLDLLEQKALSLSKVDTLVLDEADKLLNLGFKDEMTRIFGMLPEDRQNLLFSATLNPEVQEITQMILHRPKVYKVEPREDLIDQITQQVYYVPAEKKGPLLRHVIRSEKFKQVLLFTSSVRTADNVAEKLNKNGIEAKAIHSKKSQGARTAALVSFKSGKLPVLVATDLLSRGIDIANLSCVINYELPRSPKDFIHRIGRTGRAEAKGLAISLVTPEEEHHFRVIQKKMGKRADRIDWSMDS